jgi:hypothetical protein
LEKTIQTQLSFDQDEKRAKSEERFRKISVALATLVIFEVFSTYFSWRYPQGSIIGEIAWNVLIISMGSFIIWVFVNMGLKMTIREMIGLWFQHDNVKTKKTITRTFLSCPNCDATYAYDSALLEIKCQNCAKVFKKDDSQG